MKIELKNITKSFNSPVIKQLSYTFEAGKLYVIKGVSGCGKTTLMNIIGGIDSQFEGEVVREGVNRIGYVFQNSLLLSGITIGSNLKLIKNSPDEILSLCREIGAEDLLPKYPEQISGGERQRIAIVRALLGSPELLLADEPTASLDAKNSELVAETLNAVRSQGRILIVCTHEHYFDQYADEIINLDYGTVGSVEKQPQQAVNAAASDTARPARGRGFDLWGFTVKRGKKRLGVTSLLPLIIAFLLVMLISTVQKNFETEYLRMLGNEYPLDMIVFNPSEYDRFPYRDRVRIYENYTAYDGDVSAYYLLNKRASVFCVKGMIEYGEFPSSDTEILVSQEYVRSAFGDGKDMKSCVGKTILFKGKTLTISGVITDVSGNSESARNFNYDSYYHINLRNKDKNLIFIPYDTISRIGEAQYVKEGYFVTSYDGLLKDGEAYRALRSAMGNRNPNEFYRKISSVQRSIDNITGTFVIVLAVSFVISCIFMVSVISSELFYRKKELGYLQIFGVSRKKVCVLISAEYLLKLLISLVCSVATYFIIALMYGVFAGNFVTFNILFAAGIISAMSVIYMLTVFVSARIFLRKSVFDLIYEAR